MQTEHAGKLFMVPSYVVECAECGERERCEAQSISRSAVSLSRLRLEENETRLDVPRLRNENRNLNPSRSVAVKMDDPRLAQIHSDIARLAAVAAEAATRDNGPAFVSALKAHREAAQRLADATK